MAALDIAARYPGASDEERKQLTNMYRYVTAPILSLEVEKLLPVGKERDGSLIRSLWRGNRLAKLVRHVDGMLAEEPAAGLYLIKGVACYRQGLLEEAQGAFNQGAQLNGDEAEQCRMLEGLAAWERRDWQAAKAALRRLADSEENRYQSQAATAILSIESMEAAAKEIAELDDALNDGESATFRQAE